MPAAAGAAAINEAVAAPAEMAEVTAAAEDIALPRSVTGWRAERASGVTRSGAADGSATIPARRVVGWRNIGGRIAQPRMSSHVRAAQICIGNPRKANLERGNGNGHMCIGGPMVSHLFGWARTLKVPRAAPVLIPPCATNLLPSCVGCCSRGASKPA